MQNGFFLTMVKHKLVACLIGVALVLSVAKPLAAFQSFGADSNGARGIDFVVINLTENDVTVRVDCEYALASDIGLMPRFGTVEIDADSESFASEYVEPEVISVEKNVLENENENENEEFGNRVVIETNSNRTILVGSISRLKCQSGTSSNGRFVPKSNAYSSNSGSGSMSNGTAPGPNNGQISIAVFDNGYGKSDWGLIKASDATVWNYNGALGQKYDNSPICYFPVVYVIYNSQKEFDTVKDDFKEAYPLQLIGNVYYPEQLLVEFIYVQNDFQNLFHDRAPQVPRKKLFFDKGEKVDKETLFRDKGEEIVTPALFSGANK
ncbi:MAG: hypothetical protein WCV63_07470 [Negativicutes bacterium]|jgi:hypothetical protein